MKKIILIIVLVVLAASAVVLGYLWEVPRTNLLPKPYFPKTLFSIERAPSKSLAGRIIPVSKTIQLQSRTSDFAKSIDSPTLVQQGEEVDTLGNEKGSIVFDRFLKVDLLPSTQIALIQTLPVNFVLEQKAGSAVFQKKGNIPISIRALDLLINLQGSANISVDPDNSTVEISDNTGGVKLAYVDTNDQTQIVNLKTGEKYLFNNNTKTGDMK